MPSPIASVLAAQGGRYGSNTGGRQRSSRVSTFGVTAAPSAAPTAGAATPSQFATPSGYIGKPVEFPNLIVPPTPGPQPIVPRTTPGRDVPPPTVGPNPPPGVTVGPVNPPPSGVPPVSDPNRTVPPPGTGHPPVGTGVGPVAGGGGLGRGGLGPNSVSPGGGGVGTGVAPLPGAPYGPPGTSPTDVTPPPGPGSGLGNPGGGGGGVPGGGGNTSGGGSNDGPPGVGNPPPTYNPATGRWEDPRSGRGDVPWGDTSPTDPGQPGAPPGGSNVLPVSLVEQVGGLLPGEQRYYDDQIARRARGLYETAEAKTNYGLERLEDRGLGQSSVAGNVAAENFGQYVRDADAAAADVQAKQFSSREQRMADARKFEFDKALQAAQYALAQKDENGQTDEQQLQAALAMFGQAFGAGGYGSLYNSQYQNRR